MTETPPVHIHHSVDYFEITVTDVAAAKAFYAAAFGWKFNDYGPDYAGIQGPDKEAGGLCKGEVTQGGPLLVLYSETLEASVTAVTGAGGRVVKEIYEFPGGRRFNFSDPSGNEMAVWTHA